MSNNSQDLYAVITAKNLLVWDQYVQLIKSEEFYKLDAYSCFHIKAGTNKQLLTSKTLNFKQAGEFYRRLDQRNQDELIENLSGALALISNRETQYNILSYFYKADINYGERLSHSVKADITIVKNLAAVLNE